MHLNALQLLLLVPLAFAASSKNFPKFKNLVAFGDSYTDEGRLAYFVNHNDTVPPKDWMPSVSNDTWDGGYTWPRMIANKTGMMLYDYAVAGASCSNLLTPRGWIFPSVKEYQVPQFQVDFVVKSGGSGHSNSGTPVIDPSETIVTMWVGTNDLGNNAIFDDSQVPGTTLVNVTSCAVDAISDLYKFGMRNFIFQNAAPLYLAPQYASFARDGAGLPNHYFSTRDTFLDGNYTLQSDRMREEIFSANEIWRYQLQALALSLPEAKLALFSSHDLMADIIYNPKQYLDAPYNTTGYIHHCNVTDNCATSYVYDPAHPNGYAWYDELHPSERTEDVIAQEMIKAMSKQSKFGTYFF